MAYTSEIDKLERRFAENPTGRNFAPLADAYRKAGELDRAIELCQNGLERHPDYVSAHIVYGRCRVDQKNDVGAEEAFRKVLTLDPENIIGLKILAEIAERGSRFDDAVEWLGKLLAADPMNGDAAEALARAKGKAALAAQPTERIVPAEAAAEPAAPPAAAPAEQPSLAEVTTAAIEKPEFVVEHTSVTPVAPGPEAARPSGEVETFDGTLDFNAVAHEAAKAEGLEVQEDVVLQPQRLEVEGLARTHYESNTFAIPAGAEAVPPSADFDEELPHVDLPLIMPDDVEPLAARARRSTPPAPAPPPAAQPAGPAPLPPVPAAVALSDDDGAADTAALSQAELVVTETMAELYLKQGHQEDALRVYRALLERRPGDVRLRAKVAHLSGKGEGAQGQGRPALSGQSAQAFLKGLFAGQQPAPSGSPAPAPGSTLEGAFADTPAEPEGPPPGSPTRPAADSISLEAVFGDEEGRASAPGREPSRRAEQAAAAPPPAAGGPSGGFSFDDFFGSPVRPAPAPPPTPPAGAGGATTPAAPEPPAPVAGPATHPPPEEEGGLDQFQAWLKGLKS